MGYRNLIQNKLVFVFNKINNLARWAVFESKKEKQFNFETGDLDYDTENKQAKIVVTNETKLPGSDKVRLSLMVRNKPIGTMRSYDTMTLDGITYKIDKVTVDDKFVSLIEVVNV